MTTKTAERVMTMATATGVVVVVVVRVMGGRRRGRILVWERLRKSRWQFVLIRGLECRVVSW